MTAPDGQGPSEARLDQLARQIVGTTPANVDTPSEAFNAPPPPTPTPPRSLIGNCSPANQEPKPEPAHIETPSIRSF